MLGGVHIWVGQPGRSRDEDEGKHCQAEWEARAAGLAPVLEARGLVLFRRPVGVGVRIWPARLTVKSNRFVFGAFWGPSPRTPLPKCQMHVPVRATERATKRSRALRGALAPRADGRRIKDTHRGVKYLSAILDISAAALGLSALVRLSGSQVAPFPAGTYPTRAMPGAHHSVGCSSASSSTSSQKMS